MKKSRIIWIIIIGVIVYWGAAYPTLGNWIEALSVKLQPAAEVIDESTNRLIDNLNEVDDATLYKLRLMCSDEVKRINGIINFEKAVRYQRSE